MAACRSTANRPKRLLRITCGLRDSSNEPGAMTLPAARTLHLDRLGTLLSLVGVASLWLLPFVVFKLNRIVSGHPRALLDVLPPWSALTFYSTLMLVAVIA